MKEQLITLLEEEKWYPGVKPTQVEFETAELLNKILGHIIEKVKQF